MDPRTEQKLDELLALTHENNAMLKKIRRSQKWAAITRVAYWLIIIGISVGAFYFVQPFLNQYFSIYGVDSSKSFIDNLKSINDPTNKESIKSLLDSIK